MLLSWKKKRIGRKKNSNYRDKIHYISTELMNIQNSLKKSVALCDKESNNRMLKDLPLEEMLDVLKKQVEEATRESKEALLRLNSIPFLTEIRNTNHAMRKRLSSIDLMHPKGNDLIKITCHKAGRSWNNCLIDLEDANWKPTSTNGNVNLSHFYLCKDLFTSAQLRGD